MSQPFTDMSTDIWACAMFKKKNLQKRQTEVRKCDEKSLCALEGDTEMKRLLISHLKTVFHWLSCLPSSLAGFFSVHIFM